MIAALDTEIFTAHHNIVSKIYENNSFDTALRIVEKFSL